MTSTGEHELEERLARLESVTDTGLAHLDVDDLLQELLNRVRSILEADTAAVLLLDEAADELIARAACGIEAEVREGVRIPLGVGFAGRIAATKAAVRLDCVDETTVANPILWEQGIQVMLGVPLLGESRCIGVLHVGRLEQHPFTDDDVDLLDREMQPFETGTFATVVCAVTKPPYDAVMIAVAGHPPPVVAIPGQPAAFVDVRISPPVGAGRGVRRESVTVRLPPGAVMALYTDGLVERRRQSLDVGLELLRATVTNAPADRVARDIMHRLVRGRAPSDA